MILLRVEEDDEEGGGTSEEELEREGEDREGFNGRLRTRVGTRRDCNEEEPRGKIEERFEREGEGGRGGDVGGVQISVFNVKVTVVPSNKINLFIVVFKLIIFSLPFPFPSLSILISPPNSPSTCLILLSELSGWNISARAPGSMPNMLLLLIFPTKIKFYLIPMPLSRTVIVKTQRKALAVERCEAYALAYSMVSGEREGEGSE